MSTKSKKVIFRVNEEMYDFIRDFAKNKGFNVSDMCRNIINYWYMAYFTGDLELHYDKLKEKFLCLMNNVPDDENNGSSKTEK